MLYLDTSAFLKLYVRESGSELVQQTVANQSEPIPVWDILEAELHNALQLKVFWKELSKAEAAKQHALFQQRKAKGLYYVPEIRRAALMDEFRQLSAHTSKLGCRTMDVLHVACACHLGADHFLGFDARQNKLAKTAGLHVLDLE